LPGCGASCGSSRSLLSPSLSPLPSLYVSFPFSFWLSVGRANRCSAVCCRAPIAASSLFPPFPPCGEAFFPFPLPSFRASSQRIPVRRNIEVALVWDGDHEDYTRGAKIITPTQGTCISPPLLPDQIFFPLLFCYFPLPTRGGVEEERSGDSIPLSDFPFLLESSGLRAFEEREEKARLRILPAAAFLPLLPISVLEKDALERGAGEPPHYTEEKKKTQKEWTVVPPTVAELWDYNGVPKGRRSPGTTPQRTLLPLSVCGTKPSPKYQLFLPLQT